MSLNKRSASREDLTVSDEEVYRSSNHRGPITMPPSSYYEGKLPAMTQRMFPSNNRHPPTYGRDTDDVEMAAAVAVASAGLLTKPAISYACLIAEAINSVPEKKMTLAAIYKYLMDNYPYFRYTKNGWQNSIRHNLSLNKAFQKIPRLVGEPGKGMFWVIDSSHRHLVDSSPFSGQIGGGNSNGQASDSTSKRSSARQRPVRANPGQIQSIVLPSFAETAASTANLASLRPQSSSVAYGGGFVNQIASANRESLMNGSGQETSAIGNRLAPSLFDAMLAVEEEKTAVGKGDEEEDDVDEEQQNEERTVE